MQPVSEKAKPGLELDKLLKQCCSVSKYQLREQLSPETSKDHTIEKDNKLKSPNCRLCQLLSAKKEVYKNAQRDYSRKWKITKFKPQYDIPLFLVKKKS